MRVFSFCFLPSKQYLIFTDCFAGADRSARGFERHQFLHGGGATRGGPHLLLGPASRVRLDGGNEEADAGQSAAGVAGRSAAAAGADGGVRRHLRGARLFVAFPPPPGWILQLLDSCCGPRHLGGNYLRYI